MSMSRHSGPEFTAPDDQRCEALVRGLPRSHFQWMRKEHRCPKRANQMRGGLAVCHIHARAKNIIFRAKHVTFQHGEER